MNKMSENLADDDSIFKIMTNSSNSGPIIDGFIGKLLIQLGGVNENQKNSLIIL